MRPRPPVMKKHPGCISQPDASQTTGHEFAHLTQSSMNASQTTGHEEAPRLPARRRRHNNPTQTHFYFQTKTIPHLGTSRRGGAPTTTQHTNSRVLPNKDNASPRHQPARRRPHNNPTHRLTIISKQRQCLTWAPAGAAAPPQQPNTQTHFYFTQRQCFT